MEPDEGSSAFWRNPKVSLEEGLMAQVRETGVSPLWPFFPLALCDCYLVCMREREGTASHQGAVDRNRIAR